MPHSNELNFVEECTEYKNEGIFSSLKCETKQEPKKSKTKTKSNNYRNIPAAFTAAFTLEEVEEKIKTLEERLKSKPEEADKLSKAILFERAKIEVLG